MSFKEAQSLPVLLLQKATKVYGKNKVCALDAVSTAVYRGEFIALCGPSGSGKSTLLNLMGGIDYATAGQVYLLGKNSTDLSDREAARLRAQSIGFIFQFFNLLPVMSVFDNICYPLLLNGYSRRAVKNRVFDIIERVGLKAHYKRTPAELSGGQQQRVAIARALVKQPCIVIADEPTGNLDSRTGDEIIDLLCRINEELQTTCIISSHSQQLRDRAKRVIDLEDGKIKHDIHIK